MRTQQVALHLQERRLSVYPVAVAEVFQEGTHTSGQVVDLTGD